MKNLFLVIIFLLLSCLTPFKSLAANSLDVIINEIAWMGTTASANDEWIELYNNTDSPINLEGWQLISQDGTPKITLSEIISANGFYLLERTNDDTVLGISADKIYTGALGNNGEYLKLYDNLNNLIDEVDCSTKWFAGDNTTKQTMETLRQAQGENREWQTSENPGGTPKSQNSNGTIAKTNSTPNIVEAQKDSPAPIVEPIGATPTGDSVKVQGEVGPPPIYPIGIVFNEILPSPEGADDQNEWIEIYNQNNFDVNLSGWKIGDIEGAKTVFVFPANTKIKAKNYLVLPRPLTKITLNNTSDELKLSQPNNKVIDSVTFQKAPTGQSYNKIPLESKPLTEQADSGWMWSSTLTPGAANIIFSDQTITKAGPKQNQNSQIDKTNYSAGLAGIYSSLGRNLPGAKDPWFLFLIAIIITIISGLIVIFIKWKMRKNP